MTNQEIRKKIIELDDKIHDARYYISSDSCNSCERMYKSIAEYQEQIKLLKSEMQKES